MGPGLRPDECLLALFRIPMAGHFLLRRHRQVCGRADAGQDRLQRTAARLDLDRLRRDRFAIPLRP